MTRFADRILRSAIRLMPVKDDDWARAMQGELAQIGNPNTALTFALGCYRTALKRKLATEHYEPLGRAFVCLCLGIWAAAKLYLSGLMAIAGVYPGKFKAGAWENIDISLWQTGLVTTSLFAYAGAAFALMTKRWFTLFICLFGAMVLNSAHFASVSRSGYYGDFTNARLLFSYAVIGEDYFILTATVVGAFALYWWPRVMAGERPWAST